MIRWAVVLALWSGCSLLVNGDDGDGDTPDASSDPCKNVISSMFVDALSLEEPVDVSVTGAVTLDTDTDMLGETPVVGVSLMQSDNRALRAYHLTALDLPQSGSIRIIGNPAAALVIDGEARIAGSISVSSRSGISGAGEGDCDGPQGTMTSFGGGGGGYGSVGGTGGPTTGLGINTDGGEALAVPDTIAGGCGGGRGGSGLMEDTTGGPGGSGGGALLIVGSTVSITATGSLSANGGGGGSGAANESETEGGGGGGGGSGGLVAIEASCLSLLAGASLSANGGGGGEGSGTAGTGQDGEDGMDGTTPASGGDSGNSLGAGGEGAVLDGPGDEGGAGGAPNTGGGGGGGGGGYILIRSPQLVDEGTTSPPATMLP